MCSRFLFRRVLIAVIISALIMIFCSGSNQFANAEDFSVIVSPQSPDADDDLETFKVEVLNNADETSTTKPTVLIYHSHTFEAYEQNPDELYVETEKWRTKDSRYNVIAIGAALERCLQALGVDVVHDQTIFEPPSIDQAYDRSCKMLEKRMQAGENYDLIIDLHRDALSSQATIKKTVNIGGETVARFMVLIGKGTTGGYDVKPDWESNLVIAQSITDHLNDQFSGLARDIKIKTGRFNQHISDRCILIECGMNTNTLDEVIAGIPYLAEAIKHTLEQNRRNPPMESESIRGF